MAIGTTTIVTKDGGGTDRAIRVTSSDAAGTGNLAVQHVLLDPTTMLPIDPSSAVVALPALRASLADQHTSISNTTETTIVTAGGSGVYLDLYRLLISNTSATATNVTIRSGTAGTIKMVIPVPAATMVGFSALPGAALKQVTSNTPWTAQASGSVSTLYFTASTVIGV